jgi:polyribonucleotide nucleotidyltransferase
LFFFPSAIGETTGNYLRRDCRGDDQEILIARLIDRPIRPMLLKGWKHDTQILSWVLSYDKKHPSETLAINCASMALALSDVRA